MDVFPLQLSSSVYLYCRGLSPLWIGFIPSDFFLIRGVFNFCFQLVRMGLFFWFLPKFVISIKVTAFYMLILYVATLLEMFVRSESSGTVLGLQGIQPHYLQEEIIWFLSVLSILLLLLSLFKILLLYLIHMSVLAWYPQRSCVSWRGYRVPWNWS